MSKDDIHVLMCKIIAYLYACMKNGSEPDEALLAHDSGMLDINKRYWVQIMRMLDERGYVTGLSFANAWDGYETVFFDGPMVTLSGVEFMYDNSAMRKAAKYLKDHPYLVPKAVYALLSGMLV